MPLKRHQALVSLSREHHDGLLLAVRLQQGRKALERLWSHDPMWQANFVIQFFEEHLDHHFQAEEQVLFPLLQNVTPELDELVLQLCNDHKAIRAFIIFFRNPDEKKLECSLTNFGKLLESHIRCEERQLFPLAEQHLTVMQLLQIEQHFCKQFPEIGELCRL